MTQGQFDEVVSRLKEASKRRADALQKMQLQRELEELAGLTFKPTISEHSKSIIARRQDMGAPLRYRVEELMRLQKAKRDKVKMELEKTEAKELTFKPNVLKKRVAGSGPEAAGGEGGDARRTTGHLLQYDIDRRIRAEQRKILISEMESRDLTFSPAINRNSLRIVERMKQQLASGEGGGGGGGGTDARPLRHDFMPGHEEEKFKPLILARSQALAAARIETEGGLRVVDRLYKAPEQQQRAHAGGSKLLPTPLNPEDVPVALPGVRQPWTEVPYDPKTHDFILRRLKSNI
jgi:hypothetical protein